MSSRPWLNDAERPIALDPNPSCMDCGHRADLHCHWEQQGEEGHWVLFCACQAPNCRCGQYWPAYTFQHSRQDLTQLINENCRRRWLKPVSASDARDESTEEV